MNLDVFDITEHTRTRIQMGTAALAVVAVFVALGAVAWLGWGLLAGALFAVGVVAGVSGPPIVILMFREAIPNIAAIGLAIAAQVGFAEAALVRRSDGEYEWTVLREDGDDYFAQLSTGERVPIDADDGELFRFGFGKLAVVEVHDQNVEQYTTISTPGESTQATDERAGVPVAPPRQEEGGILVSLAAIQRRIRGSASSSLVRRGRDKALDERGGTGQLSELWTMAFATVLLVVAFVMTAGALMI